jgi:YidC/Oxa1 family membrane protein insertase
MNIFAILFTQPLANGLILFYRLLGGNLGLAIIGFSVFLRFVLNPLTRPYMESMKKMKEFGPQLAKLKKKHGGDRQKLLQAQADFYKEKGINPGSGCLPYLLQIVILIALFNVFMRVLSGNGIVANFNNLLYGPLKLAEDTVLNTRFLYLDMTKPDTVKLAFLPFALPGPLLILAALSQALSAKIMSPALEKEEKIAKATTSTSDDFQAAMQSSAVYTFPLLTIIFGLRFPSGLALYWLLFSLFQLFQQYRASGWGGATPWINKLRRVV